MNKSNTKRGFHITKRYNNQITKILKCKKKNQNQIRSNLQKKNQNRISHEIRPAEKYGFNGTNRHKTGAKQ